MWYSPCPSKIALAAARCALLGLCAVLGHATVRAQPALGTLLLSPAERQQVVNARHGQTEAKITHLLELNGLVQRRGGKSTVWMNGQMEAEGGPYTTSDRHGAALVHKIPLQVGQMLDLQTGTITDVIAPGAVKRQQSHDSQPSPTRPGTAP